MFGWSLVQPRIFLGTIRKGILYSLRLEDSNPLYAHQTWQNAFTNH